VDIDLGTEVLDNVKVREKNVGNLYISIGE
jgi:hypothetical protein